VTAAVQSETEIMQQILLALGAHPACRIWRMNTGALPDQHGRLIRFGVPGMADIIGLLRPSGRFLAIEVKTLTGRQSDQQRAFQRMVEAAGGIYILARSVDEAVEAVLRAA
jgi:hypothetical protein